MTRRPGRSCLICGRRTTGASRCPAHTPTHTHRDAEYRRNRLIAFARDNYRCTICGRGPHDGTAIEAHHIIELRDGGTHDLSNLATRCFAHNPRGNPQ